MDVETANEVRRDVGLVAWVVLEAIASGAAPGLPEPVVVCSTRSLAEVLGISKDTVARAIRTLIQRGHLVRWGHREEPTGRFGATSYRIDLAAVGVTVLGDSRARSAQPLSESSPTPRTATDQLTLLQ